MILIFLLILSASFDLIKSNDPAPSVHCRHSHLEMNLIWPFTKMLLNPLEAETFNDEIERRFLIEKVVPVLVDEQPMHEGMCKKFSFVSINDLPVDNRGNVPYELASYFWPYFYHNDPDSNEIFWRTHHDLYGICLRNTGFINYVDYFMHFVKRANHFHNHFYKSLLSTYICTEYKEVAGVNHLICSLTQFLEELDSYLGVKANIVCQFGSIEHDEQERDAGLTDVYILERIKLCVDKNTIKRIDCPPMPDTCLDDDFFLPTAHVGVRLVEDDQQIEIFV